MNTTDLYARWSALSWQEIDAELREGKDLANAARLLGLEQVAEHGAVRDMRAVSGPREAVILLPGLMGSLLSSIRGVTQSLWINPGLILQGQSRYLELDASGTREAVASVQSVPTGLERICYLKMALTLQRESHLFEFPYDWRLPVERSCDLLDTFIERWADGDASMQFTLVGHSLGGLVSRAYLARHRARAQRRLKRVIMLGTPHFGAAGAVADLWLGNRMMAVASALNDKNDIRRMVLNMPSAYQLVPAPPDLFPKSRPYPANFDVYDAAAWGLPGVRQDYLDAGRRFHELLADHNHPVPMFQILGCHQETKTDVALIEDASGRVRLELTTQPEGDDSGDATVPLYSARLPGATLYYVQEVHRYLPRNDDVIEATLDLVYGRTPKLPATLPKRNEGFFGQFRSADSPEVEAERMRERFATGTAGHDDYMMLQFMD